VVEREALIDTGATLPGLPAEEIRKLGLSYSGTRRALTAKGPKEVRIFGGARLTILDRTCSVDVMELEDGVPALVGYVPLQVWDLVVDPVEERVVANPVHGDEIVPDLY
jgi:predicted aspartyl protease